jgi:histidinol-phosphatase
MSRFLASDLRVDTKPDLTPVTDADTAVEAAIRTRLERERPADDILGEEFGTTGAGTRRWVIDPIDGTKNFVRGVPVWATLIALMDGPDVVVGVVAAPALGRRWWASKGGGSHTGGSLSRTRTLRVSAVNRLEDASFSYSDAVGWDAVAHPDALEALQDRTWRSRAYGDFWSHVLVAEGAIDVAAEPDLGPWDVTAIVPIVTEAGGRITSFTGGAVTEGGSVLTTNAVVHDAALALVRPR